MSTTTTGIGSDAEAAAAAAKAAATNSSKSASSSMGLDKDAFLKILVEQLRNQDPSSQSNDSSQYVQQMTQYAMLEQLTNISESVQVQHADTAAATAMGLVGHTISWKDDKDATHSGVVDKVTFGDAGPTLTVGDTTGIQLATITEVK